MIEAPRRVGRSGGATRAFRPDPPWHVSGRSARQALRNSSSRLSRSSVVNSVAAESRTHLVEGLMERFAHIPPEAVLKAAAGWVGNQLIGSRAQAVPKPDGASPSGTSASDGAPYQSIRGCYRYILRGAI